MGCNYIVLLFTEEFHIYDLSFESCQNLGRIRYTLLILPADEGPGAMTDAGSPGSVASRQQSQEAIQGSLLCSPELLPHGVSCPVVSS